LLDRCNVKNFLKENYPILTVLAGYLLVALSTGPYTNGDVAWETQAVQGVMKYGLPYTNGFYLMDQPPLGFYIQAAFAKAFGLSLFNGAFLVTLFGLGAVLLVYFIGKEVYNKTTGFFAALLFAFNPWQLVLSRTFLIDVQCLFFSLLTLFVGIGAIKKSSFKLLVACGFVFAAAFSTKLYAAFILIPLFGYFLYRGPKQPRTMAVWVAAFALPALFFSYLWYQTITGLGLFSIFGHTDFNVANPNGLAPTYFFATNFLVNYGLGWFFLDAVVLSLLVYLIQRRLPRSFLAFDVICVAVIVCALSVNTVLGAVLNLKAPYLDAVKYDFQTLPFFSFLAASLVSKSIIVSKSARPNARARKIFFSFIGGAGIVLVAAAIVYNMRFANLFSNVNYLLFRVTPNATLGYSLVNSSPLSTSSLRVGLQFLGFAVALSGIFWISRQRLHTFVKNSKEDCGSLEKR
jgi:4-amino-4-deoxy-L-arabinose transferase-like glycosyltransferase